MLSLIYTGNNTTDTAKMSHILIPSAAAGESQQAVRGSPLVIQGGNLDRQLPRGAHKAILR